MEDVKKGWANEAHLHAKVARASSSSKLDISHLFRSKTRCGAKQRNGAARRGMRHAKIQLGSLTNNTSIQANKPRRRIWCGP